MRQRRLCVIGQKTENRLRSLWLGLVIHVKVRGDTRQLLLKIND